MYETIEKGKELKDRVNIKSFGVVDQNCSHCGMGRCNDFLFNPGRLGKCWPLLNHLISLFCVELAESEKLIELQLMVARLLEPWEVQSHLDWQPKTAKELLAENKTEGKILLREVF